MSQRTHLPHRASHQDPCRPRLLRVETLEDRRLLSATRAAGAVNQFAYDVYEHMQNASGNLFYSPLSVATALAMTYAGAAGQTALEMEQVLGFGTEPGIHSSFRDLLSIFQTQTSTIENFDLEVANAIWPALGLPILSSFIGTVEDDYSGHVQNLNYGNPTQARNTINTWIRNQTHGNIPNMIDQLSPDIAMILTNAVYFKALWERPFDPRHNFLDDFQLGDGETVLTEYMFTDVFAAREWIDGFDVIELPFEGGASSMVLVMPLDENSSNELTPEIFSQIDAWLAGEQYIDQHELMLPKFATSIKTDLKQLLIGMGMPTAFSSGGADFSGMTDEAVWIEKIYHKATIEVNEQGTEASAATVVELPLCFAAGTPVLTPDGEVSIEELKAGDYVLARDEHNLEGAVQSKMVERLLTGEADILELHVAGKIIRTTSLHPFFVRGRGWTPAGEIKVEDRISTNHGDWIEVEKVLVTNKSEAVYNLRVADRRTYFIGSRAWKFGLWVHNYYDTGFYADHPFHMMIRDNVTSTITFMGRINDPAQSDNGVNPTVVQTPTSADFDGDGDIDGRDFLAWQRGFGMNSGAQHSNGDSNSDGDVDADDLHAWQASYAGSNMPLAAVTDAEQTSSSNGSPDTSLVDAAMAWVSLSRDVDEVESLSVASDIVFDVEFMENTTADHLIIGTRLQEVDSLGISAKSDAESSSGDEYWLADELLERVFG
jgi:serpin B